MECSTVRVDPPVTEATLSAVCRCCSAAVSDSVEDTGTAGVRESTREMMMVSSVATVCRRYARVWLVARCANQ